MQDAIRGACYNKEEILRVDDDFPEKLFYYMTEYNALESP